MVTIEDVARTAGVSTATVSRALRGLPHVSGATRLRITGIAAELGYIASRSASSLATGRTRTVGVVTPYVSRWFFASALEGLEVALREHDYDVLLLALAPGPDGDRPPFDPEVLRKRVDAVAVLTVPLNGRELDGLRQLGLPMVFVGAAVAGAMSVRIDDVAVGRMATEHLLGLGHTCIGHLGGDPAEPINFSTPADRRAGWMQALRAAGVEPEARLDVPGFFTVEGGRQAMERLLALPSPPTAVFAASDEMAIGALTAARAAGLQVPRDLSVVGVDDHDFAELFGLTTVRQCVTEQARAAAGLLLEALDGDPTHSAEHQLAPAVLVQRGSTAFFQP